MRSPASGRVAVLLVTGGRLGDRWSPKRAYVGGMVVFTLASLACGLAPSVGALIAARVAQGAGAALMTPQVIATIHVVFAPPARTRALSLFAVVNGGASVLAQVAGGLLIHLDLWGLGWRVIFLVNVPIGVAGIAAAAVLLPRRGREEAPEPLDVGGVVLLTSALLLLTVPLVEGRQLGWPLWIVACLVAFGPMLAALLLYERRVKRCHGAPLFDVTLLAQPTVRLGTAAALLHFAQAAGMFFVLTLTLQSGLGLSPFHAGLLFAPLGLMFPLSSALAPRLVRRHGPRVVVAGCAFCLLGTTIALACSLALGDAVGPWALIPPLMLVTWGNGLMVSPLFSLVLGRVRQADAGLAAGTIATSMQLGAAIGIALVGLVFAATLGGGIGAGAYASAFAAALGTILGLLALLTAAAVALVRASEGGTRARASTLRPGTSP